MAVGGEGVDDFVVTHDGEGDAVREGPFFVGAVEEEAEAALPERLIARDDGDTGVYSQRVVKPPECVAIPEASQGIGNFRKDPNRGHQRSVILIRPTNGGFVATVGGIDRRLKEIGVGENGFHDLGRLGVPWM